MSRAGAVTREAKVRVSSITPFLWFNDDAEEAVSLYVSVFDGSKVTAVTRFGPAGPGRPGDVFVINFELAGREFIALNVERKFAFTPAFSLQASCRTQRQVDEVWDRLSEGGTPGQCGWLEDRFGLSWQVVPERLEELLNSRDPEKATRVFTALMAMKKIEVAGLERAARGE